MQVSRPTPRGKFRGIWPRGRVSRPTPKREVEGDLTKGGGSPGPHPRGNLRGTGWGGGLQAHTQGEVEGDLARGVSRPTPRGSAPGGLGVPGPWGCGDPWMATAVGGTRPTGMHSCLSCNVQPRGIQESDKCLHLHIWVVEYRASENVKLVFLFHVTWASRFTPYLVHAVPSRLVY